MHAGLHASSACCPATNCASAQANASIVGVNSPPGEYNSGAFHWLFEPNSEHPAVVETIASSAKNNENAIRVRARSAG